jgi:hypothetical protein
MDNFQTNTNTQPKGKIALDIEHRNILEEDERRIDMRICTIYGVNVDEASEIHTNYHLHRIFNLLKTRATKHGMTEAVYAERLHDLNLHHYAMQVSKGRLNENAAVDILYEGLTSREAGRNYLDDRYNGFYG